MSTVRSLYGRTAALKFGPRALKRVRDQFLAAGQARIYINQNVARIARIWKWASGEELIPVTAWKHFRGCPSGLRGNSRHELSLRPKFGVPSGSWKALGHIPG